MAERIDSIYLDYSGFRPETAGKVRHLLIVLDRISKHPYLESRVCLHGGTALNLFILDVPRLSVDIDLNYIGSTDRDVMYAERPKLERGIIDIGKELGYEVSSGVAEHSGRTFKLRYQSEYGSDFVKVDVDYLNRSPLLPVVEKAVETSDGARITFPLNSDIEVIGGKVKALLGRVVPRDLYDVCKISEIYLDILSSGDERLVRRIMLYCASLSDPFPRPFEVAARFVNRQRDMEDILYPTLVDGDKPDLQALIDIAATFISEMATPKESCEAEYLSNAAKGEFQPELLFDDYPDVLEAAQNDPAALWKMQNLRNMQIGESTDA